MKNCNENNCQITKWQKAITWKVDDKLFLTEDICQITLIGTSKKAIDKLNNELIIEINDGKGGGQFNCDDLDNCSTKINNFINDNVTPKFDLKADKKDLDNKQDKLSALQIENINDVPNKADKTQLQSYYTKTETDNKLKDKADLNTLNNYYKKTEINNLLDTKQNSGYLNYNSATETQNREFFQTFDIENEFIGLYGVFNWFESFQNLERTGLIASVVAIDGNDSDRYMTGFIFYNKLPNRKGTIVADLTAGDNDKCIYVGNKPENDNAKYCAVKIKIFYNTTEYAFFEAVNDESGINFLPPFTYAYGSFQARNINKIRYQIITFFGNNNGKLGVSS